MVDIWLMMGIFQGGSIVMGVPLHRWMIYFRENPMKMDEN